MSTANIIAGSLSVASSGSLLFRTVTALDGAAAADLTAAQVLGGFFTVTPTGDRTYTLPTAAALATAIGTPLVVGQTIEFSIQNNAANGAATGAIVAVNTNITNGTLNVVQLTVEGWLTASNQAGCSGSGSFLLVCTNATTPAFTLYRRS